MPTNIGFNTILATDELNLVHRGTPCREMRFHDNVLLRSQSKSVKTYTKFADRHLDFNKHYGSPDPTNDLAVGDFDGDGVDDIFVGTGVAWYFSSGGRAEWRFLNRMPERASELLFGDFDGDGRTYVMALHSGVIDVSWAGGSRWQSINVRPGASPTSRSATSMATTSHAVLGDAEHAAGPKAKWLRSPGATRYPATTFVKEG